MEDSSQTVKLCYLCGQPEPDSRDHIPPKNLFLKNSKGAQLLTVSAHAKCQQAYSHDDEILRDYVVMEAGGVSPSGQQAWDEYLKIARRRDYIRQRALDKISPILNSDGRPIAHQDAGVIERQARRWLRAIHYKFYKKIVEDEAVHASKINTVQNAVKAVESLYENSSPLWYSVEAPIFRFAHGVASDTPQGILSVFILHDAIAYAAWTKNTNETEP